MQDKNKYQSGMKLTNDLICIFLFRYSFIKCPTL